LPESSPCRQVSQPQRFVGLPDVGGPVARRTRRCTGDLGAICFGFNFFSSVPVILVVRQQQKEVPLMWPFKGKSLDIATLPPIMPDGNEWSVSVVDDDGPWMIRLNHSAQAWARHPSLPIKLGFAIPLLKPNPGGMPDANENLVVNEIEDVIKSAVNDVTPGIHVVTNTTGIMKELLFYIPKDVDIKTLHESLDASVETHDLQCIGEMEPKWPTYQNLQKIAAMGQQLT